MFLVADELYDGEGALLGVSTSFGHHIFDEAYDYLPGFGAKGLQS